MQNKKPRTISQLMDILETNKYMNPAMQGFNAGHEVRKLEEAERAAKNNAMVERLGGHAD